MSLARPRSSVNLTRKIIDLLAKPVYVTDLEQRITQLKPLLKQLDDPNVVIDINILDDVPLPMTILIQACMAKYTQLLELVITELKNMPNFDIDQVVPYDVNGVYTPIQVACTSPHNIKLVLDAGADLRLVSPKSSSPLAFAINAGYFESAGMLLKHMLQTHATRSELTQKDIAIYADALACLIKKKNESPMNLANCNALFDAMISILSSPHSGYPADSLRQMATHRIGHLHQKDTAITLCAQALLFADAKAIAVFKPFMTESILGKDGCIEAIREAIRSNSALSYLTLFTLKFDLLDNNSIFHAAKCDSDLFLQFALNMIAKREQCDSIRDLLARRDGAATNGRSLLMAAVGSRAIKVVKFLFANGVSVNELDDDQKPIFWRAIQQVGPDLLNPTIQEGIAKEIQYDDSELPSIPGQEWMMRKDDKNALDVVEIFLSQQLDTSYVDPVDQNDCFMVAAQSQNYYLSHLLVTRFYDRIDLDRKNAKQQSLTQVAARYLNVGLLRLILDLRSKRAMPPQLTTIDHDSEAGKNFSDCMFSYLLAVDEKWLLDSRAKKFLNTTNMKDKQRRIIDDEVMKLLDKNVIASISDQGVGQSDVHTFRNILMFFKEIDELLVSNMGVNTLEQSNSLMPHDFERFSKQVGMIIARDEELLHECLSNMQEHIKNTIPRGSDDKEDPQYTLNCVLIVYHMRSVQYCLSHLAKRLSEWIENHSDVQLDSDLYNSTIKLIRQLSTVIGGIFDSLQLTDLAVYLFKDMVELGNDVRENLNLIDQFKNNTTLRKKSDKNRSADRPQGNNIKHQSIFFLTQEERSEIDANIAKMRTAKQNTNPLSVVDPVVVTGKVVSDQPSSMVVDKKNDHAAMKRKAKNAKKKARLKNRNSHSAIPEELAIERAEAVSSQDQSSDTPATISKSVSLTEKIDQLEARILRRQQMWEVSEAKKLFDKQRERIETTLSILRLIKRDEQPESTAEFEMKVRAEFKKVYQIMGSIQDFYLVGGSVINFRKNIKFDSKKYDVDIVGKVADNSVLCKFRMSLFLGDERSNLYMYKSDLINLDLLCYKPDAELDLNDDVLRRDYTICSVYLSMKGYVDPTGYGLSDIDNNILRMNGNPEQLKSDPVRLLRGLKYILRGFNPEPKLHAVLMSLDESLFQNLDKPKMISLQIKSREFFEAHQVDWRNVLAHYQLQHRPKPVSTLQAHGTLFYTASQGSVSSNQTVPEYVRPSLSGSSV